MKKVILIGASGHTKVVKDIIEKNGDCVLGYILKDISDAPQGLHVLGNDEAIGKDPDAYYFAAIGNADVRERIMSHPTSWYTAVHPSAIIADDVVLGEGTCVMAGVVINPGTRIGKGVIINTGATVDHDCEIADFVHVAPGAHLCGSVSVGEKTWIGVGSAVVNNVKISKGCMIGAGAVVVHDLLDEGTYVGTPAKKIK